MLGNKAVMNWSGGKDSSLTLYHVLKDKQYDVKYLVTSCSEEYDRISMHGVRVSLLKRQAELIGIPLKIIYVPTMPTMAAYDAAMAKVLTEFKNEGIEYSIFGDIFLEDLRKYREERLAEVGLKGVFPIWKRSSFEAGPRVYRPWFQIYPGLYGREPFRCFLLRPNNRRSIIGRLAQKGRSLWRKWRVSLLCL